MLPVAISACWFAVGVALGAVIRRTLPAVFGVIGGFIGLMLLVQFKLPHPHEATVGLPEGRRAR